MACNRQVVVAGSDTEEQRDGADAVDYYLKSTRQFRPVGDHEKDQMIFGGPETCVEKLRILSEKAGINNLICWMNFGDLDQETVHRSMRLFAEAVIPAFRSTATNAAS